jgi:hypothetical protein
VAVRIRWFDNGRERRITSIRKLDELQRGSFAQIDLIVVVLVLKHHVWKAI